MKEEKACANCGAMYHAEQLFHFDDALLCRDCLHMETVVCAHCGTRVWNNDNYGDDGLPLCEHCYNEYYTTCSHCEHVIHCDETYYDGDDEPYCFNCYNRYVSHRAIHDYYYKPIPEFYGDDVRFLGLELEVDCAGEDDESAETVMDIANSSNELVYCKHDGSLDDGFEIVTHPMTLNYHMSEMKSQ